VRGHFAAKKESRFARSPSDTARLRSRRPTRAGPDARVSGQEGPGRWGALQRLPSEGCDAEQVKAIRDEETKAEMRAVAEGNGAIDYVGIFNAKIFQPWLSPSSASFSFP